MIALTGLDGLRDALCVLDADDQLDDRALDRVVATALGALPREVDKAAGDPRQLRLDEDNRRGGAAA